MLFAAETYYNYNRAGIQYNLLSYDWGIGYIPLPLSVHHYCCFLILKKSGLFCCTF